MMVSLLTPRSGADSARHSRGRACSPRAYANSTLYSGLREGASFRRQVSPSAYWRRMWCQQWGDELREGAARRPVAGESIGRDHYDRRQDLYGASQLSMICNGMLAGACAVGNSGEQALPGSWYLPFEIGTIPLPTAPTQFGATHSRSLCPPGAGSPTRFWRWLRPHECVTTLRPLVAAVNTLARVSSNDGCSDLPPASYAGNGRPRVRQPT